MATSACVSDSKVKDKCLQGEGRLSTSFPFLSLVPTTWQECESNILSEKTVQPENAQQCEVNTFFWFVFASLYGQQNT